MWTFVVLVNYFAVNLFCWFRSEKGMHQGVDVVLVYNNGQGGQRRKGKKESAPALYASPACGVLPPKCCAMPHSVFFWERKDSRRLLLPLQGVFGVESMGCCVIVGNVSVRVLFGNIIGHNIA